MILNMYKPKGCTSFDLVRKVRKVVMDKKVGHAGTLDPFAEGVLIIGTGKDTKRLTQIAGSNKGYIATLKLGTKTDTLDPEGNVIKKSKVPKLTNKKIKNVLNSFCGQMDQIPPMYSAKKVNGQRLYKLARKNIEVEREPCKIEIFDIEFISYKSNSLTFRVECSKGTYVRVLGSDIAEKLDTIGHLSSLTRISVGEFQLDDSLKMNDILKK